MILDKRIIGFRQSVREFLKSKTNQTALITIVSSSIAFHMGEITASAAAPLIMGAVFAMTIKDATVK